MNQPLRAFHTLSPSRHRHRVKLLVAVGVDGNAVVVNVLEGNPDLLNDVTTMEAAMALWPSPIPKTPGLYLFSGYSQWETLNGSAFDEKALEEKALDGKIIDASDDTLLKEVFHRCTYRPVSSAELSQLESA